MALPSGTPAAWPAMAFDDARPGIPERGQVTVDAGAVIFRSDQRESPLDRDLRLQGLHCRVDGIHNDTVHLSHPESPGFEIVVQGVQVLQETELQRLTVVEEAQRVAIRTTQRFWAARIVGGCAALLALIAGAGALVWLARTLWALLGG